ncbi:MAG: hypothetical protein ACLQDV_16205 [Candidatus Binataceae bacterium]
MPDPKPLDSSSEARRVRREAKHAPVDPARVVYKGEGTDLQRLLSFILDAWRSVSAAVLLAVGMTLVLTTLVLQKTYRATGILRPTSKSELQGRVSGTMGGLIGNLGSVSSLMGGLGSEEAQEYMTILKSFAFNTALVERHHLGAQLSKPGFGSGDPRWRAYMRLMKRFSCEYSTRAGNLTLYFEDSSESSAERVLGFYIDDLRERLRGREVQDATAAIDSLKQEARVSSDALLQTQLYELIAKQTQQLKLAQVEADFAFRVLEPPMGPDKPYRPRVLVDVILAGLAAFAIASTAAIVTGLHSSRPEA